ncbi:MAG TPA: hypothetical protein PKC18_07630, partial [Lacipirellulaceae bacterium]|nr:hypothetical protein [Lacipirellulaceae bacterium]
GHGTAEHRGWVFAELCRQQGIEVVALQPRGGPSTPLLMGALVDGQLYLFDPALGLPLPGAEGGVASLAAIAEQPDLLRQLDLPGGPAYPLTAEQLADVEALVIASPLQLARRSARLERALEGEEFVKLAADASAIAERATALPHVAAASLWTRPFQAVVDEFTARPSVRRLATAEFEPFAQRPLLWKARILHFQGNKQVRADQRSDPLAEPRLGHNMAVQLYQDRTVRPPDSLLAPLEQAKQAVYQRAKAASSYWVALLSYDLGRHDIAASWLRERTLDREPRGTWAPGARYNLARTYEAQGRLADAITLLRSDPRDAPQRTGNLIRAQQLEARLKQASQDDADGAADSPSVSDG